jgi:ankyrin repeat protein
MAIAADHLEMVTFMIEKGVNFKELDTNNLTPLHRACACGNLDVIKLLRRHGAEFVTPPGGLNEIARAADAGHVDVVKYLFDEGAPSDTLTSFDGTPLDICLNKNHDELSRYLFERGVPINSHQVSL